MKRALLAAAALLALSATSAFAIGNWVPSGTQCKSSYSAFIGQLPGLGYSVVATFGGSTKGSDYIFCLRSGSVYSLWHVGAVGGNFCRLAYRQDVGSACNNPTP